MRGAHVLPNHPLFQPVDRSQSASIRKKEMPPKRNPSENPTLSSERRPVTCDMTKRHYRLTFNILNTINFNKHMQSTLLPAAPNNGPPPKWGPPPKRLITPHLLPPPRQAAQPRRARSRPRAGAAPSGVWTPGAVRSGPPAAGRVRSSGCPLVGQRSAGPIRGAREGV